MTEINFDEHLKKLFRDMYRLGIVDGAFFPYLANHNLDKMFDKHWEKIQENDRIRSKDN